MVKIAEKVSSTPSGEIKEPASLNTKPTSERNITDFLKSAREDQLISDEVEKFYTDKLNKWNEGDRTAQGKVDDPISPKKLQAVIERLKEFRAAGKSVDEVLMLGKLSSKTGGGAAIDPGTGGLAKTFEESVSNYRANHPGVVIEVWRTISSDTKAKEAMKKYFPELAAGDPPQTPGKEASKGSTTSAEKILAEAKKDTGRTDVDCTHYVLELTKRLGWNLDKDTVFLEALKNNYPESVKQKDQRIKGVVLALVQSGKGQEVDYNEVKPGDFIQYGWLGKDGSQRGHVGVVAGVKKGTDGSVAGIDLFGANGGGVNSPGTVGSVYVPTTDMNYTAVGRIL